MVTVQNVRLITIFYTQSLLQYNSIVTFHPLCEPCCETCVIESPRIHYKGTLSNMAFNITQFNHIDTRSYTISMPLAAGNYITSASTNIPIGAVNVSGWSLLNFPIMALTTNDSAVTVSSRSIICHFSKLTYPQWAMGTTRAENQYTISTTVDCPSGSYTVKL